MQLAHFSYQITNLIGINLFLIHFFSSFYKQTVCFDANFNKMPTNLFKSSQPVIYSIS